MTNHLPQSSEDRLKESVTTVFETFSTQDDGETLVLHCSEQEPMIDAIMQAVKAELGAALIKELTELKEDPNRITHHGADNAWLDGETIEMVTLEDIDDRIAELRNHFGIGEDV